VKEFNRHDEKHVADRKRDVVDVSKQVLNNTLGLIEASRKLYELKHDLDFLGEKEDWNIIVELYSDSDYLPLDKDIRKRWSKEGLNKMDKEIEEIEKRYENDFLQACRKLVTRFSA